MDGFIDGIEVEYAADIPDLDIQKGPAVIRHLILLWAGDHPGQCEVTKVKRIGKKACRCCHVCGIPLEPAHPIITMEIVGIMQDTNGQLGVWKNQFSL